MQIAIRDNRPYGRSFNNRVALKRAFAAIVLCLMLCAANQATAQKRFELVAPRLGLNSQASLTRSQLQVVSATGAVTEYSRDPRFDSADGNWLGFASRSANQVLRWPVTNSGNMQIGQLNQSPIRFQFSQMTIRPLVGFPNETPGQIVQRPVLPPDMQNGFAGTEAVQSDLFARLLRGLQSGRNVATSPEPSAIRLASFDDRGSAYWLAQDRGVELIGAIRPDSSADWWIAPLYDDLVRIETYRDGRPFCLTAQPGSRVLLQPLSSDPKQLWRVAETGFQNQFMFQSVRFPSSVLSRTERQISLQPVGFSASQFWLPFVAPQLAYQPFVRTISQEIRPNPPLPPARVDLFNSHRNALVILLGSSLQADDVQQIRIEPKQVVPVTLPRDAGATIIETAEYLAANGVWREQHLVTTLPATAVYDLSVYEEHLQSIAIDRTGKSPNPIEDVNYVPKSVGQIFLTAGPELPESSRLDVFPRAKAANNPGAVRRFDPRQFDEAPADNRLESLLNEVMPRREKF